METANESNKGFIFPSRKVLMREMENNRLDYQYFKELDKEREAKTIEMVVRGLEGIFT